MKTAIKALTDWIFNDNNGLSVTFCDERHTLVIRMLRPDAGFTARTLDVLDTDDNDNLIMVFEYCDYNDNFKQFELGPSDPHAEQIAERVRFYINELAGFDYITR